MRSIRQMIGFIGILLILSACTGKSTPESLPIITAGGQESSEQTTFNPQKAPEEDQVSVYRVINTLVVRNAGDNALKEVRIWVAMIQHIWPYQIVLERDAGNFEYDVVTDDYGNQYAEIVLQDIPAWEERTLVFNYKVAVNAVRVPLDECRGAKIDSFLEEEDHIDIASPEIRAITRILSEDTSSACEQSRAFYDFVADSLEYTSYQGDDQGAYEALKTGGGDCTEFSDLFITMNRIAYIPARFLEGVTYQGDGWYEADQVKHDWAEVYLPGIRWVPVDVTWGQPLSQRENFFGSITSDHIIITRGRNLEQLDNHHYFYYQYSWFEDDETTVKVDDNWYFEKLEGVE